MGGEVIWLRKISWLSFIDVLKSIVNSGVVVLSMTIAVSILVPEGVVLAADSRQVVSSLSGQMRVDSDNAIKIHQLNSHLAAVIIGQGSFYFNETESPQSIGEFFKATVAELPKNNTVKSTSVLLHRRIGGVLKKHLSITKDIQSGLIFYIAGYDKNKDVGELYRCDVPGNVNLERKTTDPGAIWKGESSFINRLILGYDPLLLEQNSLTEGKISESQTLHQICKGLQLYINFQTMPLQDAVDLATLLVQITIDLNRISNGLVSLPGRFPACGGKIDVAVVTRSQGFQWLQRKELNVQTK